MRPKLLSLLVLLVLLSGCGKQMPDALTGEWYPYAENTDRAVYLFREDGTGEKHIYTDRNSIQYDVLPLAHTRGADTLAITLSDGSVHVYAYTLTEDCLILKDGEKLEKWRPGAQQDHISSREMGIQFWIILAGTMGVLLIQHLIMPYDFRYRPSPDQMPERFAGTFSQGQLVQFLLQSIGMPLIYELEVVMVDWLELPRPVCVAVGVALILLWGVVPRKLARRMDGW